MLTTAVSVQVIELLYCNHLLFIPNQWFRCVFVELLFHLTDLLAGNSEIWDFGEKWLVCCVSYSILYRMMAVWHLCSCRSLLENAWILSFFYVEAWFLEFGCAHVSTYLIIVLYDVERHCYVSKIFSNCPVKCTIAGQPKFYLFTSANMLPWVGLKMNGNSLHDLFYCFKYWYNNLLMICIFILHWNFRKKLGRHWVCK